jgi:hypothetical protein
VFVTYGGFERNACENEQIAAAALAPCGRCGALGLGPVHTVGPAFSGRLS